MKFDLAVVDRLVKKEKMPPHWVGLKFFNVYGPNEYHKGKMISVVKVKHDEVAAGGPARLFRSDQPGLPDGQQKRDFIPGMIAGYSEISKTETDGIITQMERVRSAQEKQDAIKDQHDGTLSYRKSCRMSVCGSCGMRIDGGAALACKTSMRKFVEAGHTITVSPIRMSPPSRRPPGP